MLGRNVYLCYDLIDTNILDYARSQTIAKQILKVRQELSGSVEISNITGINFAGCLKCSSTMH